MPTSIGRGIGTGSGRRNRGLTARLRLLVEPATVRRVATVRATRNLPTMADAWRHVINTGLDAEESKP
jgi:hypothetical protein